MRRKTIRIIAAIALAGSVGAGVFAMMNVPVEQAQGPPPAVPTSTADVRRVDVVERRQVAGVLGHEGSYTVSAPGQGTLTAVPAIGTVVHRGEQLFEVNGQPVLLLYGQRPAWRTLQAGVTNGADVEQLESNLMELGFGDGLTVDETFTAATTTAVRRWQQANHLTVTGAVPLGLVVFLPEAIRIANHELDLGVPVEPGALVERATSDRPAVTLQLLPRQLPTVKVGDPVVITMPDGTTRTGRITSIGAVTVTAQGGTGGQGNAQNQPAAPVAVQVDGDTGGFLDQSQVQVGISVGVHTGVLAVPITALNGLPSGGYEVVVVDGSTTRRVQVRVGLFDEFAGLAEVSGPGLAEGQKVRVPSDQ
jgi:HlyD family secretion protein